MTDAFDDRRRAQEEEFIRKKEQQLIELLRKRRQSEAERESMSEVSGIEDEPILATLQEIGFTHETVLLLHLVPLVHVAWVDGGISQRERELILAAAAERGVREGSVAYGHLVGWLDRRPSEDFFDGCTRVIRVFLELQEGVTPQDLLELMTRVAKVSGGILGIRSVSAEERAVIEEMAALFHSGHAESTARFVGSM